MKNKKAKQVHPYELEVCDVKFETDFGLYVIRYDFKPVDNLGADTIMDLAKKVHEYIAGLCISDLNELEEAKKLASPIVEIECCTKSMGFSGCRFSIMCDYSSLFSDVSTYEDLANQFKPVIYIGSNLIGEVFKYA